MPGEPATLVTVVVAAIIVVDGRVLVSKRLPHVRFGGMWEFPGGKVEPPESEPLALVRELREELGVEIAVEGLYDQAEDSFVKDGSIRHVQLRFYRASLLANSPSPRAIEVAAFAWVGPEQLAQLTMPPVDAGVVRRVSVELAGVA
jgi:8-oxo-dGTP diphosphatase